MIAQFFQSPMLFNFLEQLKETINVGYVFTDQDVFLRVGKEAHEYFFVYLLLWFYLHFIDYTSTCIIKVASVISVQ